MPGPWPGSRSSSGKTAVQPQEWRALHRLEAILLLKHTLLASISATWARSSSCRCLMLDLHRAVLQAGPFVFSGQAPHSSPCRCCG